MRVVRSVQDGESPEAVARTLRVTIRSMYGRLADYRGGGWNPLKAQTLAGRPPKVNDKMLKRICGTVTQKMPMQPKCEFAFLSKG